MPGISVGSSGASIDPRPCARSRTCENSEQIINFLSYQLDYHYLFIIKFKWSINMINAEDDIIVNLRTSCTKDEAVAMLLGWLRGPIKPRNIQISEDGLSLDQLPFLQSLEGSLQDQLQELVDAASQAFRLFHRYTGSGALIAFFALSLEHLRPALRSGTWVI